MNRVTKLLVYTPVLLGLVACAAAQLNPGAERVRFAQTEPQGCEYLGEATGNQGNFFSGAWTSNANLETGARNELKNQAAAMGGNVIVMLTNRAGQTGHMSGGSWGMSGGSSQTNVTITGTVFRCPTNPTAAAKSSKPVGRR